MTVIGRESPGGMFRMPDKVRAQLEPEPRLTVSQWAVKAPFWITEKGAAYPGPYDLTLTPYMREPLDAMGMPGVRRMNWVMSPQSGKTKAAEVGICWRLKYRPTNWLYVRPTEPDIDEAFRDRFAPMIRENLPQLVPRGAWVTLSKNQRIELTNQIIYGAAATIARQFTSRTTGGVYYDETDTGDVTKNSLGDALDTAGDRQMMVADDDAITLGSSSAKYENGPNWQGYIKHSDARVLWEPCPECGAYQELPAEAGEFERRFVTERRWDEPEQIVAERLARFVCGHCGALIPDTMQGWMSDRGVWVPRGQWIEQRLPLGDAEIVEQRSLARLPDEERWDPVLLGPAPNNPHRGYRVWAANVKVEARSWSRMLMAWFKATATRDADKIQVVVNSWKSLPWKDSLKAADEEVAAKRIGQHPPREVPNRAKVVLGSIDIQEAGYLSYEFWAFGKVDGELTIWQVETGTREVIAEDYLAALRGLYHDRLAGWPVRGREGWRMRPYAMAVDSGARTGDAYEFSRLPGVLAVKGVDDATYTVRHSEVEGKLRPEPVDLFTLNNKVFGSRLHRLVVEPTDGRGSGLWFHEETTPDYLREITAEELRKTKNGKKTTWQLKSQGRRNEATDKGRYILALQEILEMTGELSVLAMTEADHPVAVFIGDEPLVADEEPRRPPPVGDAGDDFGIPEV